MCGGCDERVEMRVRRSEAPCATSMEKSEKANAGPSVAVTWKRHVTDASEKSRTR